MAKSEATPKKQRKRNRVPISCTICRRRKVKCDKKKPQCTNCIKNGVQHLCRYLEPSWAKPLDEEELKFPGATVVQSRSTAEFEQMTDDADEIARLKLRIRELEHENTDLKKGRGHQPRAFLRSGDNADLIDCICNSNILFTAKKGPTYNFPIIYQISVMSWMFIVRNDSYLNDLWLKILKLRKHYEYYYSSKNAMVAASKTLENESANYDSKMSKIKVKDKPEIVSDDKIHEHTSKLKKFLEGTLLGDKSKDSSSHHDSHADGTAVCPVTHQKGKCPVQHDSQRP
ncbi:unnamed protein product [Ambrosiozyma monospora]|uniref:Unnamed protein product n=1 Tax=Ambrosiozyma monospora TaxID=43982 RepID=A0ACB5T865_AMBMO|nr:unnamed protein product [Ambrosiozyma monospora]